MLKFKEKFGMTFAKKWTNREPEICRERKWINIPAKHRPLGFIPWKQTKGHLGTIETWANTIEEFAYILTTSNLHVLAFDNSRKSTQISCSLKLNSKTKYRLYLVNY